MSGKPFQVISKAAASKVLKIVPQEELAMAYIYWTMVQTLTTRQFALLAAAGQNGKHLAAMLDAIAKEIDMEEAGFRGRN